VTHASSCAGQVLWQGDRLIQLTCPKVYHNKAAAFGLEKFREVFLGGDMADRHCWAGLWSSVKNERGDSPNGDDYARISHKTMIDRLAFAVYVPDLGERVQAALFVFLSGF